ncbi:AP2 domain-containing protein [Salisaeta longa]|uniref:AP2 domain-containing protein n=1 Tax=Salisaeta longa TaxID=503170 RepID=UPI0003B6512E|nr:AP2 domain-containing protein [Salisaeta longa]
MPDKPKNVFRIDIEPTEEAPDRHPTHGWQVRIKRQKKQHTKYFSDKRFGGTDEALEAAVAYRDELLDELPDPLDPVKRSAEARSKTGVIGLNFCWKDDGSGTPKPYVQLSWLEEDGTRRSAAYSVRKWNLRRAVWKACVRLHKARQEHNTGELEEVNAMFQTAYPNIRESYMEGPDGNGLDDSAETPDADVADAVPAGA